MVFHIGSCQICCEILKNHQSNNARNLAKNEEKPLKSHFSADFENLTENPISGTDPSLNSIIFTSNAVSHVKGLKDIYFF